MSSKLLPLKFLQKFLLAIFLINNFINCNIVIEGLKSKGDELITMQPHLNETPGRGKPLKKHKQNLKQSQQSTVTTRLADSLHSILVEKKTFIKEKDINKYKLIGIWFTPIPIVRVNIAG